MRARQLPAGAPHPQPKPAASRAPDPKKSGHLRCRRPETPRLGNSPPLPPSRCAAAAPPPTPPRFKTTRLIRQQHHLRPPEAPPNTPAKSVPGRAGTNASGYGVFAVPMRRCIIPAWRLQRFSPNGSHRCDPSSAVTSNRPTCRCSRQSSTSSSTAASSGVAGSIRQLAYRLHVVDTLASEHWHGARAGPSITMSSCDAADALLLGQTTLPALTGSVQLQFEPGANVRPVVSPF